MHATLMIASVQAFLAPVFLWARKKSRVGLGVVGSLPDHTASAFFEPRALPIGIPTDANHARHADVLVVVGRVSHKLAPFLVRTHASMARPAQVLWLDLEPARGRSYASVDNLADIMAVDVVVRARQPTQQQLARALSALDATDRGGVR